MNHKISVSYANRADKDFALTLHLRRCISAVLQAQGVAAPCEINVFPASRRFCRGSFAYTATAPPSR